MDNLIEAMPDPITYREELLHMCTVVQGYQKGYKLDPLDNEHIYVPVDIIPSKSHNVLHIIKKNPARNNELVSVAHFGTQKFLQSIFQNSDMSMHARLTRFEPVNIDTVDRIDKFITFSKIWGLDDAGTRKRIFLEKWSNSQHLSLHEKLFK